jgi:GTPase SAR1 family protein
MEPPITGQVLLMGPSFSGKTTLAETWAGLSRGTHRVTPKVTLVQATVKGVQLFIMDCGGTEISRMIAAEQADLVDYAAFVFDATSTDSFNDVKEMIVKHGKRNALLIATKTDLEACILGPDDTMIEEVVREHGMKLFKTSLVIPVAMDPANWIASDLLRRRSQAVN